MVFLFWGVFSLLLSLSSESDSTMARLRRLVGGAMAILGSQKSRWALALHGIGCGIGGSGRWRVQWRKVAG